VGGWINVYQQVRGIATLVDFYLTVRDPTGKSIHLFKVQHHLCLVTLTSLMPASLIQSLPCWVRQLNKYIIYYYSYPVNLA